MPNNEKEFGLLIMNAKARDSGKKPGKPGYGPGWMARSPAMVILPTHLKPFQALQPWTHRLSTWSHSIASRWAPRLFGNHSWRGMLDLALHPRLASRIQRKTYRWLNLSGKSQRNRWALHTLSLPEGIRIGEQLPESWDDELAFFEPDQVAEQSQETQ